MVPLRDNNPITITPYVTYALIGANIFVFLYQLTLTPAELEQFFRSAAVVPCQLSATCPIPANQGLPEWMTLFTSQFLHGGFLHIAGNMLFLWILVTTLKTAWGM